jgi:alpha-ketoglutarate-dependent taurine dioxygenase
MTIAERVAPEGSELPVLITPAFNGETLPEAFLRLQADIEGLVETVGGVLLRGFLVPEISDFKDFASSFGNPLLTYEFGSTPRSALSKGVYTSTSYPAHQHIPLHNEQAYTREWARKIWFHSVLSAQSGGETPIADSRAIYQNMPLSIRNKFKKGLLYVRNYGDFDLPWQQVFNTENRAEVEAYCRRTKIECQWTEDDGLRTSQLCQGIEQHYKTGEKVWFNQGHLFHISNLQAEVRESLEDLLDLDEMPRNVYFADGSVISDDIFTEVRAVLAEQTVLFPWENGDVLMLDNMLVAHARTPFEGERQVVVAMADPHSNLDREHFG